MRQPVVCEEPDENAVEPSEDGKHPLSQDIPVDSIVQDKFGQTETLEEDTLEEVGKFKLSNLKNIQELQNIMSNTNLDE